MVGVDDSSVADAPSLRFRLPISLGRLHVTRRNIHSAGSETCALEGSCKSSDGSRMLRSTTIPVNII